MTSIQNTTKFKNWISGGISCLKLLTTISCIVGFVLNSMVIFRHFVENKTITSINKQLHPKLFYPSLTLCNHDAFKERIISFDGLDIETFKNNTFDLKDMIKGLYTIADADSKDWFLVDYQFENGQWYKSDTWQISTVYSQFRGRCFTIEYLKEAPAKRFLGFIPKKDAEFLIIAHDTGEEYFVHHETWPTLPQIYHVKKDDYGVDLLFEKITNQNDDLNCQNEPYRYFDCLRNALTVNLKNIDYICNLPWMSSMTDAYNNPLLSPPIFPTCDSYDSYLYSNALLLNFTTTAANYDHPTCTAPCKTSTFEMGIKSFKKESMMTFNKTHDHRAVLARYSKTVVTEMTTSKLIDTATFISSIGGNLGLFVGFSFINGFFFMYEYVEKLMIRN